MSKQTKKKSVVQKDQYQVTEADVLQFFDSVLVCDTNEEWLAVLADGEKYQNQVKGLTPIQRKNVKRFAKMMNQCQ